MYYRNFIITSIEAERILAMKFDEAFAGVKKNVIDTLNQMGNGITRASYYTSCLMDNYQGVCSKLKQEDTRFIAGLAQLVKSRDIIFQMIKIYIETNFQNKKEEKAQYILKKLVGAGVYISSSGLTNRILIMAVATMICQASRFNTVVYGRINRARSLVLKGSVTATAVVLNVYGLIQDAANSADNLKMHNPFYYNALYANHLEMMYFLIEPVITGVPYLNPMIISDDELAELLIKLMR
ncbi:TPA: hypothetical protein ACGTZY_000403 [Klebsiella pneumoniae]